MLLKIRQPADKAKVLDYVSKLPDSKLYDITINIHRQTRTIPQNKLYWMWINCISRETGNEPSDLHEYFGGKWLPKDSYLIFGVVNLKPLSTTKLNTAEFTAYLDKIQTFTSSELGIVLPQPSDLYFDQFVDYYSNHF